MWYRLTCLTDESQVKSQLFAFGRMLFLVGFGVFIFCFLASNPGSAGEVEHGAVRVIYGGNLLGMLEPCG